jgi:hypothetical protein
MDGFTRASGEAEPAELPPRLKPNEIIKSRAELDAQFDEQLQPLPLSVLILRNGNRG